MLQYHIITYGCQMNKSDSERIASKLESQGNKPVKKIELADLVVVNICSVRQSAIDRVYSKVRQIRLKNPKAKITLTGCILEKDKQKLREQVDDIWQIVDLETKVNCQSQKHAFVPIMTGCDNFCSYCVVPYTRGREQSRPAQEIIKEVRNLVKQGYKEITLLGQNVNSYQSKSYDFPKLLKVLNNISGNFQIKFLTSHPKDMSDQLIKTIARGEKIAKEIHLPVQSGDNQILKRMNRGYTVGHYKKLVKKIRQEIPKVKISTDIIVGFPGETKKQFANTVKLVKEIGFCQIYAAAYSPRPGTAAFKLKDDVPSDEKKRRKRILLNMPRLSPLIVILGPTASGKSELAIKLAKKFNGEIVSADSRQIYQEMDIGTAKITKKEMNDIPHYLIDIIKPNQEFTLAQYKKQAIRIIKDINKRGKLPFLVGGTGLYIQAIVDNLKIPEVKPDKKLRAKLEKQKTEELFKQLKKIDPQSAQFIDSNNKRRIIRALEVCFITKKSFSQQRKKGQPLFDILQIGLKPDGKTLEKRINQRVEKMFQAGLANEVKKLLAKYPPELPSMSGIGYQETIRYLQKKINLDQTKELIKQRTHQYARRQMTWFKRDKRIKWIKGQKEAEKLIKDFLGKK
jgi:tRNA dimethylallyltransferase